MPGRQLWSRDELLLALRLYMRLPFGKLHQRNPEIIQLADRIGRTPSAVAMKACNFASLDPALAAREVGGLKGASKADRSIWAEFAENSELLAAEAEEAAERLSGEEPDVAASDKVAPIRLPAGETEVTREVRARRVQSFFRAAVLTSYESRCAISGIGVPALLTASHIIPWSESVERRADPTNGLCLNALFDRAFDRGLVSVDEELRVLVARELITEIAPAAMKCDLERIAGRGLLLPGRFLPDAGALAWHRECVFLG